MLSVVVLVVSDSDSVLLTSNVLVGPDNWSLRLHQGSDLEVNSISEWVSVVSNSFSGQVEGRLSSISAVVESVVLSMIVSLLLQAGVTHGSDVSEVSSVEGNLLVVNSGDSLSLEVEWSDDSEVVVGELVSVTDRDGEVSSAELSDGSSSSVEDEPLLLILWVPVH